MTRGGFPSVGVVVPTRDRPALLRRALDSILGQDYPGRVHVVVVYDQSMPDLSLSRGGGDRAVDVVVNDRTPGLAGARNTGVRGLGTDLVAFCDDDDEWLPGKLRAQVEQLRAYPAAEFVCTAIVVAYDDRESVRLAGRAEVSYDDLLRSRMAMLHSSTYLARRDALVDEIGLVDEAIPGSMCEDWDILLRAARRQPIRMVDRPLVRVLWGKTSFFAQRWEAKIAAHRWMLDRHPDITRSPTGAGRVYGQLAFSHAALGRRRGAVRWAAKAIRSRWSEPRAYLALAVAAGVTTPDAVLRTLHRRGHGI